MSERKVRRLTRREAIGLVGGAGVSLITAARLGSVRPAAWQGGSARKLSFPKGAVVRTLLKDLQPETLVNGATLFHEHFSIDLPPITPRPANAPPPAPNLTKDLNLMIDEAKAAINDGVAC